MEIERIKLNEICNWLRQELDSCIEFWIKNGIDSVNGGVYTCLDRVGKVYSTDKSVWMQGRCAWTFAYLSKVYGVKDKWLDISKSCLDFMERSCINREAGNRMYFTVTADGLPLRQRRYSFSECFYCIANAEYYGVTGDKACLERAQASYELVWLLNKDLLKDPTGLMPKTIAETRRSRGLAGPMIYLNMTSIMRRVDPERASLYDERSQICSEEIIRYHYKPEHGCVLENVGPNGEFRSEVTEGRIVNPGHVIECAWFILEEASAMGNKELHTKACKMFDMAISSGWDNEYGGVLYFIDCLGNPPEAYEHDMKLWWPHNETMIAAAMLYRDTGKPEYLNWLCKTIDYCKEHFSDPEFGEWYGYLRRDGVPTAPSSKGTTFKGPFHLPRALIMTDMILKQVENFGFAR